MRHRILFAALLAGSAFSPALAQEVEANVSAAVQAEAAVQQTAMADEQSERRGRGGGGGRRDGGGEGMRAAPEQVERPSRGDWQQRQQARPVVQAQVEVPVQIRPQAEMRPERDGSSARGWQRREGPAADVQQTQGDGNRERRGNRDGGWQGRTSPVITPPAQPQVGLPTNRDFGNRDGVNRTEGNRTEGNRADVNRGWRGGNGATWNRDRDSDGVRNNRDWDRNNDGRVDRRWDNNGASSGNGSVNRRWDQDRDGVRDDRGWNGNDRNRNNGGSWNNRGSGNWNSNQRWNREWRNDRRYDWQRYRFSNQNLFRLPRYYSPYGYNNSYQRFGIGIYLESLFYGARYRISDPWRYRLPDARWPYEWVRYYDDVLLVDTRDGYVEDVIYDFFD